ncbi:serine/threonine protein kinase [Methylohalomonas lacus]|uniref:Serine/threonine protein kinase n=1 Tax=Methylohalomonas lacus TaxID=398773 RepID=A0AAE3HKV9_9GAMM|nr:protein kinase [Methylohalomonas lacus]MCS3904114.1 serine/threonine protein kinase [Methylohalomonas lacus]
MTESHPQGVLEAGYELLWYRIGRVLGRGAFGITYLAEDINLHRPVAIKEFFPSQHCTRVGSTEIKPLSDESAEDFGWAMERFLSEARTLAQFEHPNIIRVINVFERNGTAYMVMHYESGVSLSALLKRRRTLNERELAKITLPILDGLEKVHASGFIHRDIKPSNIYIREGGSPVLLDFGSARQSMQEYTQTLTSLVSPGYAPIEQYTSKGERQGPWTDIYGMAATLYRAVTGLVPPSAIDRSEALSDGKADFMTSARELVREPYGDPFLAAIDHALAFRIEDRPQNITDWRAEFGFDGHEMDTQPEYYGVPPQAGAGTGDRQTRQTGTHTEPLEQADATAADDAIFNVAGETRTVVSAASEPEPEEAATVVHSSARGPGTDYRRNAYLAAAVVVLTIVAGLLWLRASSDADSPLSIDNTVANNVINGSTKVDEETASAEDTGALTSTVVSDDLNEDELVQALLDGARADLDAMRLTTPADRNAYDKFLAVQSIDPDNQAAERGIEAIYNRYVQLAQQAAQDNDFDRASVMLDRAGQVKPDAPGLMRARVALEQRRTQTRMQSLSESMNPAANNSDTDNVAANQNVDNNTPSGNMAPEEQQDVQAEPGFLSKPINTVRGWFSNDDEPPPQQ